MGTPAYIPKLGLIARCGALLAVVVSAAVTPISLAEVKVTGKVIHAGFPIRGGVECYRRGMWCPVVVSLQNVGDEHLNGRLVLHQRDKDGDVVITESVATLTAGAQPRVYRLDFVANQPSGAGTFVVSLHDDDARRLIRIYDANGTPLDALPAPQAMELPSNTTLILDLSSRPVAGLDELADDSPKVLNQSMAVTRILPAYLPDRWYSLQSIQAIVWDRPDLTELAPQQVRALVDYVQAGGILLLAASRTADALAGSPLGEILPVALKGTQTVDVLGKTFERLLKPDGWGSQISPSYSPRITVASAKAKRDAYPLCPEDSVGIDAVTRGRWGSGLVVFVAADLRDLFQQGGNAPKFYKEMLGLTDRGKEDEQNPMTSRVDLYNYMHRIIGFEAEGGARLVFVVLLVGSYILAASAATWALLRRRDALQHCWPVFALVAIACSVLSVMAVQLVKGVGTDLRQMCIVDVSVPADNRGPLDAQAAAFFGLKTSMHTRLDVRLTPPPEGEESLWPRPYLQPLPPGRLDLAQSYVAPEQYYLRPGLAMMEAVPIRGTLKRLQGCWFGRLEGDFSALIEVNADGRLSERSWVRNNLGFDLRDCWLLLSTTDRIGGTNRAHDPRWRAGQIYAFQIKQTLTDSKEPYLIGGNEIQPESQWRTLRDEQVNWAGSIGRLLPGGWAGGGRSRDEEKPKFEMGQFHSALMLLTTLDEYDETGDNRGRGKIEVERSHGMHLDRCHLLTSDTAVIIGFADTPGPARLEVRPGGDENTDWNPVEPDGRNSHTMFRFIVPVRRVAG
ncbi:MAG: hypothetical protein JXQ73_08625 [Phycisphaerae bacterium]|nr:hypothetical protein [Phycisphaerae bacterium]